MRTVPVVFRVANSAAVHAPRRAAAVTRDALTKRGEFGVPDVVLFSEVSPVNVTRVARVHAPDHDVIQHGAVGSPDAGVAIASHIPARPKGSVVGSPATREGGGIRMRPIIGASIGRLPAWAVHPPPARASWARAVYIARARTRGGIVGGDWNQPPRWMRRTTTRKYRGIGVLGLMVPRRYRASKAVGVDIGSDHLAVDVVVWIPAWRLRRARP